MGAEDLRWAPLPLTSTTQRQYFLQKTETLIKTLVLFSSRPIHIYIINNDQAVFDHLSAAVFKFNVSSESLR